MDNIKEKVPEHIFKQLKNYESSLNVKNENNKDGIKLIKVNPYSTDPIEYNYMCHYTGDILSMLGTNKDPMFSFGTPCIEIKKNKFLGCGHVKIKQKYNVDLIIKEYDTDSAPYLVREYIHDTMYETFDRNYVTHYGHNDGYIYMLYFYVIETSGKGFTDINDLNHVKIRISDCYLPINMDKEHCSDIKSSLYLAMSLFESKINSKKMINVTAGEVDFYASILSIELSDILNSCVHEVSNFKYDNFNYHLLPYYDGKSFDLKINYKEKYLEDESAQKYSGLKDFLEKNKYSYEIKPAKRSAKI
jgi:hypothetical protein